MTTNFLNLLIDAIFPLAIVAEDEINHLDVLAVKSKMQRCDTFAITSAEVSIGIQKQFGDVVSAVQHSKMQWRVSRELCASFQSDL